MTWLNTSVPELTFTYVGKIRVERLLISRENKFIYALGSMETALIKFSSFEMLYKFLTV